MVQVLSRNETGLQLHGVAFVTIKAIKAEEKLLAPYGWSFWEDATDAQEGRPSPDEGSTALGVGDAAASRPPTPSPLPDPSSSDEPHGGGAAPGLTDANVEDFLKFSVRRAVLNLPCAYPSMANVSTSLTTLGVSVRACSESRAARTDCATVADNQHIWWDCVD